MNTTEKIIQYFEENEDALRACIEELDSYMGYLGDDRCYSMDELDELYSDTEPLEILQRAFYGHDDDTWTEDEHGNKTYGEFNPNRSYFYFNAYGNLVSTDFRDYSSYNDSYLVKKLEEYRHDLWEIDRDSDLAALFDELEAEEAAEEETEGK